MIELPKSCEVNKFIPKKTFYERVNISTSLKQEIIDKLEKIIWKYKISENTSNITKTEDIEEIEIFELTLKEKHDAKNIIKVITKEIPYPIIFLIKYNNEYRYALKHNENIILKDWNNQLDIKLDTLNLKSLYEKIIKQIAELGDSNCDIDTQLEKKKKIENIEQEISKLIIKMKNEKQFNIKVEYNKRMQELTNQIKELEDSE